MNEYILFKALTNICVSCIHCLCKNLLPYSGEKEEFPSWFLQFWESTGATFAAWREKAARSEALGPHLRSSLEMFKGESSVLPSLCAGSRNLCFPQSTKCKTLETGRFSRQHPSWVDWDVVFGVKPQLNHSIPELYAVKRATSALVHLNMETHLYQGWGVVVGILKGSLVCILMPHWI
jgi:hypothetical protein